MAIAVDTTNVVKFPTRKRKAFRKDWSTMSELPDNIAVVGDQQFRYDAGLLVWCRMREKECSHPDEKRAYVQVGIQYAKRLRPTIDRPNLGHADHIGRGVTPTWGDHGGAA